MVVLQYLKLISQLGKLIVQRLILRWKELILIWIALILKWTELILIWIALILRWTELILIWIALRLRWPELILIWIALILKWIYYTITMCLLFQIENIYKYCSTASKVMSIKIRWGTKPSPLIPLLGKEREIGWGWIY